MTENIMTYPVEEIFNDIEGDAENVLMNIPPAVAERMGWKPGDKLHIRVLEEGGISISRVENE